MLASQGALRFRTDAMLSIASSFWRNLRRNVQHLGVTKTGNAIEPIVHSIAVQGFRGFSLRIGLVVFFVFRTDLAQSTSLHFSSGQGNHLPPRVAPSSRTLSSCLSRCINVRTCPRVRQGSTWSNSFILLPVAALSRMCFSSSSLFVSRSSPRLRV